MPRPMFPTRKISETLIDFAQPFLAHVDPTTSQDTIQRGFLIVVTLWATAGDPYSLPKGKERR